MAWRESNLRFPNTARPRGASQEMENLSPNPSLLEYIREGPKMNPYRLGFFVHKLPAVLATSPNSNQVICPNRSLALSLVRSRKP